MGKTLLALALATVSTASLAQWEAERLDIGFLTTKVTKDSATVTEYNHFVKAEANVGFDGHLTVAIDVGSVKTGIDLRDERLRDNLFQNAKDGKLEITGKVDMKPIDGLAVDESLVFNQTVHLQLGAEKADQQVKVLAQRFSDDMISVTTVEPVLVDTTLLGMKEGIAKLTELAGLQTIAYQVPVIVYAQFKRVGG